MPLSGLHVACSYGGGRTINSPSQGEAFLPITGSVVWSEAPATNTPTTNVAPADNQQYGPPVMSVRCSVDAWVSTGPSPNAGVNPRRLIVANTDYDFFVNAGDRLAWVAA